MKNFFLVILTSSILFIRCKEEQPQQTLSDEKLINVLSDLHIAEAAAMSLNKKVKDSIINTYYAQVFEIHQIEDSTFYQDLKLLRKNPERVEELYTKVLEKVEQLGVKPAKEKKIRRDSLKKK